MALLAQRLSYEEPRVWKGAVAGAVAGLAASWVMTRFHVALSGSGLGGSENPQSSNPVDGRDDAASAEHYALGVTAGAFYGMWRETEHAPGGAAFGAELWTIADQVGLPMVGLSPQPLKAYPLSTNAQHLAAHIVYGISTAVVYSMVRRVI